MKETRLPAIGRPLAMVTLSVLILIVGCESKPPSAKPKSPDVYTTFYPTTYLATRIAGEHVNIVNPCPADADPAYWMPDEKTIEAYQNAALIIINGASFEKWVGKAMLPDSRLVDTTKPLADDFIMIEGAVTHSHGLAGEHTHEGVDGHTWPDPINCRTQAAQIKNALIKTFPEHKDAFDAGYAELVRDLDALGARLKVLSKLIGDQTLLASHPAYNYVGRRYGWKLKSFHLDPEEMPDAAALAEIRTQLAEHPAKYMLWEAEPLPEIAKKMQDELGLTSVVYSPCESQPEDGSDFLAVMNANVDRLEQTLGG